MTSGRWDAVVAGGGPAGAATALALARRGRSVLLVEGSRYEAARPGETLSPNARPFLAALGVWERFVAGGHRRSHAVLAAWGGDALVEQDFLFNPHGSGWNIDRRRFDAMLAGAAAEAGAVLVTGARVERVARSGDRLRVLVAQGGEVRPEEARIVVDATGRARRIAGALGGGRIVYDRLVGLGATLVAGAGGAAAPQEALLIEAAREGWWYSAPLPDGSLLVCHLTDGDLLARSGPRALWARRLAETTHTRARAAGLDVAGFQVNKAATSRLHRAAGPGWIAVGDAAGVYDPLTGRGLTKALDSAIQAAGAIDAHLSDGAPAAFDAYASAAVAAFDGYLRGRLAFYGMERRRVGSLFWDRRQPLDADGDPLHLDPLAVMEAASPPPGPAATAALEALLPPAEIERLRSLCVSPRPAHEIVRAFQRSSPLAPLDRHLIVALQRLVLAGAVTVGAS